MFSRRFSHLTIALISLIALPTAAHPSQDLKATYHELLQWQFTAVPIPVPEDGLHWQVDTASWHLDSGRIWLQRPTSRGDITGWVFEGSGRFRMTVPDPVELRQLRRFARDSRLGALDETFRSMVVRMVGLPWLEGLSVADATHYAVHPLARARHRHWLALRFSDIDARVLAGLARAKDTYLRADMRTADRGWLSYEYDAQRPEEITVDWFNPAYKLLESWLSLDRAEDRDPGGRPTAESRPAVDLDHLQITVDLTKFANESPQGVGKVRPVNAKISARLDFEVLTDGDRALQLYLHPWVKVERVRDETGKELAFVRDHLGKRSSALERRVYDDALLVLFERPLQGGESRSLEVDYELEMPGYAPGRLWYPSATFPGSGLPDLHTAILRLSCRENYQVRGVGELRQENLESGVRSTTWVSERPMKMFSFVFAKRPHEEIFASDSAPDIVAFSSLGGHLSPERVREVGADVASSLEFFQDLFDSEIPGSHLHAALIPAAHGQAFEGLLHIGDLSTITGRVAEQELFRAHEVAHLWWGHKIGWRGYRDQWLSEGLAHYSAMMFVESVVDRGSKYFEEMLKTYRDELTGSLESQYSQFNRPGVPLLNMRAADRIGPIGHGMRSVVGEAPTAYHSQTYKKGALVLHMLRMLLRSMTGSDDTFIDSLRLFLQRFKGGYPSTADFAAVIEEVAPGDWSWFFDQWVLGAEIPTYLWSHEFTAAEEGLALRLRVEQRQPLESFRMAVPVKLTYSGDRQETVLAWVDRPVTELVIPLQKRPRNVTFNPHHAVLARVKRR